MSPLLEYAGIALDIVENPYEYKIASSQFINLARSSSSDKCTSGSKKIHNFKLFS